MFREIGTPFLLCLFFCFSQKSQKNDVFFKKKPLFLEKYFIYFVLFFCIRCVAGVTELKII